MIIFGVSLTVAAVLLVGIIVARKIDGDSQNYLVAGRRLGLPLVFVSLMGAAVDSNATVGNTDLTSDFGFWAGASLAIGLAICLFISGLFFAKPLNRMRLFTLGDFFRLRYGRTSEVTASFIMIFAFTILLAGNLVACGYLLDRFANVPYGWGVVLSVLLVVGYTIAGGLYSDAYTSAIQVTITIVATVALVWWVASSYGIVIPEGMGPFDMEQLFSIEGGAPINWATLISLGIGDLVAIDFMQRIFGAKSPEVARRACFSAAALTAAVGTCYGVIALSVSTTLNLSAANGPVLFQLLDDYAPPLLAMLVLSGIIAASFSTASGAILATSAIAVRNIFGVRRVPGPREVVGADPLLRWTRLAMVPVVVCGSFLAIQVAQTGILLTLAFDIMLACLAAPFIFGVYWRRPGPSAYLAAAGVGLVVRLTFLALTPTLYGVDNNIFYIPNSIVGPGFDGWATLISAAIAFGTFIVVGLLKPRNGGHHEDERNERTRLDLEDSSYSEEEAVSPA